ncbi:MAG: hypothetical protein R3D61_08170 [Defluviimonas denitrificans]
MNGGGKGRPEKRKRELPREGRVFKIAFVDAGGWSVKSLAIMVVSLVLGGNLARSAWDRITFLSALALDMWKTSRDKEEYGEDRHIRRKRSCA